MIVKDIISKNIPALKNTDTGIKALNAMETFKISHLAIVQNKKLIGLISDKEIRTENLIDVPVKNRKSKTFRPFIFDTQHIFEIINIVSELNLTAIPVLNAKKEYVGLVTLQNLIKCLTEITGASEPGGILVLELNINDYSLSEIAQIVESNDAKILSLYVSTSKDSSKIEVTLKINRTELSPVIQTFNRYNYIIKKTFTENLMLNEIYRERIGSLIKILNI